MFYVIYYIYLCTIPTALYTEFSGLQYLVVFLLIATVVFNADLSRTVSQVITKKYFYLLYLGIGIVCSVYSVSAIFLDSPIKNVILPWITMILYLITFVSTILMLNLKHGLKVLIASGISVLFILLYGQVLVINGYVTVAVSQMSDIQLQYLTRNGGFHNANQAAGIALTILFSILMLSRFLKSYQYLFLGIGIVLTIIVISQSRSALLLFGILVIYTFIEIFDFKKKIFAFGSLCLIVLLLLGAADMGYKTIYSDNLRVEQFSERISGSSSDDARFTLLTLAFDEFLDSPVFGHGEYHMAERYGLSAHNMIMQSLVNFGLVGSLYLLLGGFLMYRGQSKYAYLFCLTIPLVFSHNLFNQSSVQVGLGFAFAINFVLNKRLSLLMHR